VEILDQRHPGRPLGLPNQALQHAEELALARLGVHARRGLRRVGHPEELEHHRQHLAERLVDQQQPPGDLLARATVVVLLGDAVVGTEDLEDGQEGDVSAVGHGAPFEHREPPRAAALGELVAEPALADPRLGHHAQHLSARLAATGQRRLESLHVALAAHELREAAGARDLEAGAQAAHTLELQEVKRLGEALDPRRAEIAQFEVAGGEVCGVLRQQYLARLRQFLHSCGEPDGLPLCGVVHAQVAADLPDHDLARVDPHTHGEVQPPLDPQLVRVAPQLVAQVERRIARPLGMVLMGDGCPEERHDAVAGVLVDGALEAVDAVRQDLEEAVEDAVPLLGVHLLGQLQGALHVSEEHGHLLALALERRLALEDLLGQVLGGVVAGIALLPRGFGRSRRRPAGPGKCVPVPHGYPLDLGQLLDQFAEGVVIDVELALEGAERDAPVAFQERPGFLDGFQEAHRLRSWLPKVGFYALGTLRVTPIRWTTRRLPALPNSGDMDFGRQSASRLRHPLAKPHLDDGRLDHVRRPQVRPVLSREVEESEPQPLSSLQSHAGPAQCIYLCQGVTRRRASCIVTRPPNNRN
jgi:hypothetical protein